VGGGKGHSSAEIKAAELKSIAELTDDRSDVSRMLKTWAVLFWTMASPAHSKTPTLSCSTITYHIL